MTFNYDPSNQLTVEQRSGVNAYLTTYSYDGRRNRATKKDAAGTTNYTRDNANQLTLTSPPTGQSTTSSYDGNGNLALENAGGSLTTYTWSPENRLLGIVYPTGAPDTLTYDNSGLRQKKVSGSTTTQFIWDQQNLLQEKDANKVTQAQYTDYPGYWGGLVSQRRSTTSSLFCFDEQGSTRLLENSAGVQSDSYLYKAFGEEVLVTGSTSNSYRFGASAGYYRDVSSRTYVRARHYAASSGRWLSQDPLMRATLPPDAYGYAKNRPTVWLDASGELPGYSTDCPQPERRRIGGIDRFIRQIPCWTCWYQRMTGCSYTMEQACKKANQMCGLNESCEGKRRWYELIPPVAPPCGTTPYFHYPWINPKKPWFWPLGFPLPNDLPDECRGGSHNCTECAAHFMSECVKSTPWQDLAICLELQKKSEVCCSGIFPEDDPQQGLCVYMIWKLRKGMPGAPSPLPYIRPAA